LQQVSRLRLVVAVPEANFAAVARGRRMPFRVAAYPDRQFTGTVARAARAIDPKTRTMSVELDVDNARGALAPGMYPEVSWPVRGGGSTLVVPATSVVSTTERTFVIRSNNGRAEWVDVRRGAREGDQVEVYGKLSPDDQILRRASDEIRAGSVL
jgi:RND family efflux transporter MFP subunit